MTEKHAGGRPRQWRDRGGENKLACMRVPIEISEQVKAIALLIDQEDPRVLEFLESLKPPIA